MCTYIHIHSLITYASATYIAFIFQKLNTSDRPLSFGIWPVPSFCAASPAWVLAAS